VGTSPAESCWSWINSRTRRCLFVNSFILNKCPHVAGLCQHKNREENWRPGGREWRGRQLLNKRRLVDRSKLAIGGDSRNRASIGQPQRGCVLQPRVGAQRLPWVSRRQIIQNPNGVSAPARLGLAAIPTSRDWRASRRLPRVGAAPPITFRLDAGPTSCIMAPLLMRTTNNQCFLTCS